MYLDIILKENIVVYIQTIIIVQSQYWLEKARISKHGVLDGFWGVTLIIFLACLSKVKYINTKTSDKIVKVKAEGSYKFHKQTNACPQCNLVAFKIFTNGRFCTEC